LSLESSSIVASSTNHVVPHMPFFPAPSYVFRSGSSCPHHHVSCFHISLSFSLNMKNQFSCLIDITFKRKSEQLYKYCYKIVEF